RVQRGVFAPAGELWKLRGHRNRAVCVCVCVWVCVCVCVCECATLENGLNTDPRTDKNAQLFLCVTAGLNACVTVCECVRVCYCVCVTVINQFSFAQSESSIHLKTLFIVFVCMSEHVCVCVCVYFGGVCEGALSPPFLLIRVITVSQHRSW